MAKETVNNYEEVRKQRVEDNKKRFEDLGILKISKSLSDLKNSEKKPVQRHAKPKSQSIYLSEPRRSSRARNPVPSYRDQVEMELPPLRKRSKLNSSWASYLARPLDEVKTATYEERAHAFRCAEKLQSNLDSGNPTFVKSMGLPSRFCEDHLPKATVNIVLEDESGVEYDAVYIGKRVGLSGGWRAFALDHKLDDGDAVVFELIEHSRFKVYVVRASTCSTEEDEAANACEVDGNETNTSDGKRGSKENGETESPEQADKLKKVVTRSSKASTRRKK